MNNKKWIIKDLLDITSDYLKSKGISSPRLSAEILLAHQLNTDRFRLYIDFDQSVSETDIASYRSLIKRLLNREPVQYITGNQEFWSLEFTVNPSVLIPRPETELLVEQTLKILTADKTANHASVILDIGTGSGAVAVSVASEITAAELWASDISEEALAVAGQNAVKHKVEDRIRFVQGDLFEPFRSNPMLFDIILSNPPYVKTEEWRTLPVNVRDYEPRTALDGHEDGMFYIKRILKDAFHYLKPEGYLMIEMDQRQIKPALMEAEQNPSCGGIKVLQDYSHKDRVLMVRKL